MSWWATRVSPAPGHSLGGLLLLLQSLPSGPSVTPQRHLVCFPEEHLSCLQATGYPSGKILGTRGAPARNGALKGPLLQLVCDRRRELTSMELRSVKRLCTELFPKSRKKRKTNCVNKKTKKQKKRRRRRRRTGVPLWCSG